MHVYGGQIAQILALQWNNYEKIYFHTRTTYISSPGRPSQSSNLSLVRRFRNERTKIITNWKEKHKETLVDSLKWILSQGLHKQHQMRRKMNCPLPTVPPIAKMLQRFTNKYRTQASDLLLQVLSLLLFNRHNLEHSEQWNYSHFFSIPTLTNYGSFPSPYPLDKEQRKKKSLIATVYVVVIVIIIIIYNYYYFIILIIIIIIFTLLIVIIVIVIIISLMVYPKKY